MKTFAFTALIALTSMIFACTDNGILLRSSGNSYVSNDDSNGIYKIGTPYQVGDIWYYPKEEENYKEVGIASWYGADFHKGTTANGEIYDMHCLTAAHRTLPLPSVAKITNLENGKSVIVRINDRGPFVNNRIIDVSQTAAEVLGFKDRGTAKVRVELMKEESEKLKKEILDNGGKIVSGPPLSEAPEETTIQTLDTPIPLANSAPLEEQPLTVSKNNEVMPFGVSPKGYFVQAGAFSNIENAERLKSQLSDFGRAEIFEKTIQDTVLFRVRIGPFETPEKTIEIIDKLESSGFEGARLVEEK